MPVHALAGGVVLEAVARRSLVHDLLQLAPVVDVLLYLEVTILDVEGVLGVDVYWHVVLQFGFLSLGSIVKVQELLPHILVISVAWQRRALQSEQAVKARLVRQVIRQLRHVLGLRYQLFVHLYYLLIVIHELLVNRQLYHVLDHARDQELEVFGGLGQRWIGVALNEPNIEVLVHHEIISEKFEKV